MKLVDTLLHASGTILATITGSAAWKLTMANVSESTGDPWYKDVIGPLGALVLALVVIFVLVRDYAQQRALREQERKEHASLLLSMVKDGAANSVRLTEALERNSNVLDRVEKSINKCHAKQNQDEAV